MAKDLPKGYKKIFQAIWDKAKERNPSITKWAIYQRIRVVRERFKKTISSRTAAFICAAEMGIDVYRLAEDEEQLKELQRLITVTPSPIPRDKKGKREEKDREIIISKRIVDTFGLPPRLAREAERMADIYPDMYVFENLIRYVVKGVLERKYGRNWWNQPKVVSRKIRENVEDRKKEERRNRWHAKRGSHEIFYTDFSDLNRIITTNYNEFKDIFADSAIQSHMKQLEHSRNIIAHNNPLPPREATRIKMYLNDLRRQLNIHAEKATTT